MEKEASFNAEPILLFIFAQDLKILTDCFALKIYINMMNLSKHLPQNAVYWLSRTLSASILSFVWLSKSMITQLTYLTTSSWDIHWKEASQTISVVTGLFEYCSVGTLFTLPLNFWINKSMKLPTIFLL